MLSLFRCTAHLLIWTCVIGSAFAQEVTKPPKELGLDPFYTKYIDADGYPIVASEKVNDYALKEAAYLVEMMLKKRPDVRKAMIESGSRLVVMEYFAEGIQSWFNDNREPDHDHNHVNTLAELIEYDPCLAAICSEVLGDEERSYTKPLVRLNGHLSGYDPSTAPTFVWPERLKKAKQEIRDKMKEQGDNRRQVYDK